MKHSFNFLILLSTLSLTAVAQDIQSVKNFGAYFSCAHENSIKTPDDIMHDYYVSPVFGFTVPFSQDTNKQITKKLNNSLEEFKQLIVEMRTKEAYNRLGYLRCDLVQSANQQYPKYPRNPPKDLTAIMEFVRTGSYTNYVLQREKDALRDDKRLTYMKWVPGYSERQTTEVKR